MTTTPDTLDKLAADNRGSQSGPDRRETMFGLTKREQRWKAEEKAAQALLGLATMAIQAKAQIAVAEAQADTAQLEQLRIHVRQADERGDAVLRRAHAAEILLDEVRTHFTRDDDLPNGLLHRIDQHLRA